MKDLIAIKGNISLNEKYDFVKAGSDISEDELKKYRNAFLADTKGVVTYYYDGDKKFEIVISDKDKPYLLHSFIQYLNDDCPTIGLDLENVIEGLAPKCKYTRRAFNIKDISDVEAAIKEIVSGKNKTVLLFFECGKGNRDEIVLNFEDKIKIIDRIKGSVFSQTDMMCYVDGLDLQLSGDQFAISMCIT